MSKKNTEATTSCPLLHHTRRRLQDGGKDLSLSLSRSIQLTLYNNHFHQLHKSMCPKSYLYTYDFLAYLHMCPSNRSEPIGTGYWISRFSVSSIRRDMFPNKLPLHSGMECRSNLICFRHAPSLSGVNTLVSMSDPFSVVWIFVSTNSRSSTRSRIQ